MINSSLKPRTFRAINNDLKGLPNGIKWRASKKGCINSTIFIEWLSDFDSKMAMEKRNTVVP